MVQHSVHAVGRVAACGIRYFYIIGPAIAQETKYKYEYKGERYTKNNSRRTFKNGLQAGFYQGAHSAGITVCGHMGIENRKSKGNKGIA